MVPLSRSKIRWPGLASGVVLGVVLGAGAGCTGSAAASPHSAGARMGRRGGSHGSSPPRVRADLPAAGWGEVQAPRFSLVLRLPDRRKWQVDDQGGHWLLLRHVPSHSELRIRTWRAPRLVQPEDCERQARLWRPRIPKPGADTVVDHRRLSKPSGYTTRAVAGVQPLGQSGTLEGFALAFGSTVGRCYAFVYTTQARGIGAEAAIADRLAVVMDGVLPQVRTRSIADRVR